MGFFKSLLFATALLAGAVSASPRRNRARNAGGGVCSSDRFTPTAYVGSKANPFCESGYGSGQAISTVTMWSTPGYVVGIQGVYSGGLETPVYGRQSNRSVTITINDNAAWSHTHLWTGPKDEYVRAVNLSNSIGQSVFAGEADPGQHGLTSHNQPVGGGIIFGFEGSTTGSGADDELDGLGFLFAYSS